MSAFRRLMYHEMRRELFATRVTYGPSSTATQALPIPGKAGGEAARHTHNGETAAVDTRDSKLQAEGGHGRDVGNDSA